MRTITLTLKGGPGSGHRGHAGRPGSVGGSVPGVVAVSGRSAKIATAIKRMMPYDNRKDLDIPASGLPGAHTKEGDVIDVLAYNPTTGELLADGSGRMHADIITDYGESPYDDYVKVNYRERGPQPHLTIDIGRVWYEDITDAWDKGFDTAWALSEAGFPDDIAVMVKLSYSQVKPGEHQSRRFILGDMVKEVSGDGWIMESTLGALLAIKPSVKVTLKMAYLGMSI